MVSDGFSKYGPERDIPRGGRDEASRKLTIFSDALRGMSIPMREIAIAIQAMTEMQRALSEQEDDDTQRDGPDSPGPDRVAP